MRKLLVIAAFGVALGTADTQAQPLGLGSSPQGTLTYTLAATVSKVLAEQARIPSRVQPSSGTGAMIPLVNSGEIDIGFCNTLELYDAFHGVGTFDKRPNPNLRAVAVIFPIRTGLFVRNDSAVKTIADLKGKTAANGFTSQEIIQTTVDAMLATGGLTAKDMRSVLVPNLIRGVDEFMAGRVDVTTFALGGAKVSEADASVGGLRYLDLGNDPAGVAAMQKVFRNSYVERVEPAPNLPGVRAPLYTMHYDYTVFAGAHVPAERVQAVVRAIAENRDALAQGLPLFRGMKAERLFNNVDVPYHDGAIAYFREKGIQQPR